MTQLPGPKLGILMTSVFRGPCSPWVTFTLEPPSFSGTFAASLAETGQGTGALGACRGAQRWMTFFGLGMVGPEMM